MYSTTGLWSFITAPALKYAQVTCSGSFDPLLGWQMLALVPSLAWTVFVYYYSKEPFVGGVNAALAQDREGQEPATPTTHIWEQSPGMAGRTTTTPSLFGQLPTAAVADIAPLHLESMQ